MHAFVGRAPELGLLRARLDEALGGRAQVALISGEPGIGKTRLAEELADAARAAGVPVAWGRASEDAGSPPYWIFRQLTGSMDAPLSPLLAGAGQHDGSAEARFAAFEAFTDQLRAAAAPDGLLAVLDDLQWADAASLALLVHLTRRIAASRLMIVATYRDTETTGREALAAALSAVAHEPAVSRARLVGLTPHEVGEQLAAVTGSAVAPERAVLVSRRTGGNPFFVTELARLVDDADDALPDAVLDAVRARLGRLSETSRQLIATGAALGSDLDPAVLAEVVERPVTDVLAGLDEAAAAGVLAVGGGWRFRHDLIRESAQLELPTAQRLAAHARLAAVLETRADAAERATQIAHHWLHSLPVGDRARASAWTERAADQALRQLAWEDAAGLYRRARETGAPLTAADRARLLRGEAVALLRGGNMTLAAAALRTAADAAREAADPVALGEVALATEGLGDPWESLSGVAVATEALAALDPADSSLRARLLALIAGETGFAGGGDPDRMSAEALAMAERLGDGAALRSALRARQMVRSGPDGVHERLALGDRMLALGAGNGDHDSALWGRLWRFDALAMLGRLDEAEAEVAPIGALAERLRRPIARWHHLRSRAAIDVARGRFDDAIAATREALALVEGRTDRHASLRGVPTTVLTMISGLTGSADLVSDEMLDVFDRAAPQFVWIMLAANRLRGGDRETARRLYARAPAPADIPIPATLSGLASYIELAAEFGPAEYLTSVAATLRPYADLLVTGGGGALLIFGSVRTYLGIAAAATGQLDAAVRELRLAVAADDRAGTPPFAALARFELAKALGRRRRPGDADEACALATSVTGAAERLGMQPLRDAAAALAATLRGDAPGPLTAREREVAGHVAAGLTNRQVAALMHISERTVESHVQHILAKLGLANRTHIATWARQSMQPGMD